MRRGVGNGSRRNSNEWRVWIGSMKKIEDKLFRNE